MSAAPRNRWGCVPFALLILYTVFIGLVTLSPQQLDTSPGSSIGRLLAFLSSHEATAWLTYTRVEMLANIGLFVPFGFLLALHCGRRRWWLGWVLGAVFTCFIEGVQATLLAATRFATLSDLVMNTLGAGIGAGLGLLVLVLFPPTPETRADREVR